VIYVIWKIGSGALEEGGSAAIRAVGRGIEGISIYRHQKKQNEQGAGDERRFSTPGPEFINVIWHLEILLPLLF
jgi:hypothetical protein